MSFWQFLNHWWNLPYLVMLGLVGVFFGLQLVGFATHSSDAEADADADVDHDLEHDADVDHDLDHDADADHEHDADHDGQSEGALHALSAFLGIGRVPFMVVWMTLFIFSGFCGLILNRLLLAHDNYPSIAFVPALLAALACGGVATRFTAGLVGKLVDVGGKGAAARKELAGRWGVVASPRCDAEFGEVRVRDERGQELLVHGRTARGAQSLAQGEKVLLLEFDAASELYLIEKFELEPKQPVLAAGEKE